jgi:hypothetical protein
VAPGDLARYAFPGTRRTTVAAQPQLQGAVVRVTDRAAVENSRKLWPQLD